MAVGEGGMRRQMDDGAFRALLDTAPRYLSILRCLMLTRVKLAQHRRIAVSYSGGSDSDIVLDIVELVKPNECGDIKYVFYDTGLEWDATRRHVMDIEQRYGIQVERRRPKVSVAAACKKHGIPFISKDLSNYLGILQRNGFDWAATKSGDVKRYGNCQRMLDWWYGVERISKYGKKRRSINRHKLLREFIAQNAPPFSISDKCCYYAKKQVWHEFNVEYAPDLSCNGMRMAEGGQRAASIKNCFTPPNDRVPYAEYRPLWYWTDADKAAYKAWRRLRYSDCYEVWGFQRTGCVGCPCNSECVAYLETARQYEPQKVAAAYAVFGASYEYRARYERFKRHGDQIALFG